MYISRDGRRVIRLRLELDDLLEIELGEIKLLVTFRNLHVQIDETLPNAGSVYVGSIPRGTHSDKGMDCNRRCDDGAPRTFGDVLQFPDDLGTFASLGQSDDGRDLGLEERRFLVRLNVQEHWEVR